MREPYFVLVTKNASYREIAAVLPWLVDKLCLVLTEKRIGPVGISW